MSGTYDVKTFCSEFTRIYNLEVDYEQLSQQGQLEFGDLCEMAGRFSDNEEDLKISNMYYSRENILSKTQSIKQSLEYRIKKKAY